MAREKCQNCGKPYSQEPRDRYPSFCTLSCGAEFGERVLRSLPDARLLMPEKDPEAYRLTKATGCSRDVWVPARDGGYSGDGEWKPCDRGKEHSGFHGHGDYTEPSRTDVSVL